MNMWTIRFELSQLKKYQDAVEAFLESEKNGLSSALQDIEDSLNNDDDYGFYSSVESKYDEFAVHFPNTLRSSIIVQSYSFLEYHLKRICDHIYCKEKLAFQLNDLKGSSDLEKATTFLKKTSDINICGYTPEWNYIKDFQKLRNVIVHSRGEFDDKKKELNDLIKKYSSLSAIKKQDNSHEILILDKNLNLDFLDSIQSFFNKLTLEVFNGK